MRDSLQWSPRSRSSGGGGLLAPPDARAEVWSSALHELTYLEIQKRPSADVPDGVVVREGSGLFEVLPAAITAELGSYAVDYATFVATYLPQSRAEEVAALAKAAGYRARMGLSRAIETPYHEFEPGDEAGRSTDWSDQALASKPLSGWFVVQFAYPVKHEWAEALEGCGATVQMGLQSRAYLVRADNLGVILGCEPASSRVAWVDSYLTTDRAYPALVGGEVAADSYVLWYPAGAPVADILAEIPEGAVVLDSSGQLGKFRLIEIEATPGEVSTLVDTSELLIRVEAAADDGQPSDEAQGLILAKQLAGGEPDPNVDYVADFLTPRGLMTATNRQTVAIFDTGYDDGVPGDPGANPHHPDLVRPGGVFGVPLLVGQTTQFAGKDYDPAGHGTMVAGIIGGLANPPTGGEEDSDGFAYGTGIAPHTNIYSVKIFDRDLTIYSPAFGRGGETFPACTGLKMSMNPESPWYPGYPYTLPSDYNFDKSATNPAEIQPGLLDAYDAGARIGNHSWNNPDSPGEYGVTAQSFDIWVRDADNDDLTPNMPLTLVVSAGNDFAAVGPIEPGRVYSPATAKNVISVGATETHRTFGGATPACYTLPREGSNPVIYDPIEYPGEDPDDIEDMAFFSRIGEAFGPGEAKQLHEVKIEPDVVAPGWRVSSTAPWEQTNMDETAPDDFYLSNWGCGILCEYYAPATGLYSYNMGTSFAAPAVSGAVALKRKQLLDWCDANPGIGFDSDGDCGDDGVISESFPSPALVKAALIATADSLEDTGTQSGCRNDDCRPSHEYGWGRVNLDRLTDPATEVFFRSDDAALAFATGEGVWWQRGIDDPNKDTLIVLVWSDSADGFSSSAENHLLLQVTGPGFPPPNPGMPIWYGNAFDENWSGWETGHSEEFVQHGPYPDRDLINNVQAVFIPSGRFSAGDGITISVLGWDVPSQSLSEQDFALYAYNVEYEAP